MSTVDPGPEAAEGAARRRVARARAVVLAALPALLLFSAARGDDVLYLSSTKGGEDLTRVAGEILDYTGEQVRIRLPSGKELDFPGERVARIETTWNAEHAEADKLFEGGRFDEAVERYRAAGRAEERLWVKRKILARLVWCYRALDEPGNAGRAFLVLYRSDPSTPDFDCIPLAWAPGAVSAEMQRQAADWMRGEEPVAPLLGASYLLSTPSRQAAADRLRGLSGSDDARVAWMAQAQLWRLDFSTVTPDEIETRLRAIRREIPEPLRAGPYYVLGRALAYKDASRRALLAMLRVPILYAKHRGLAARALLEAAEQLQESGDPGGAVRLYRELKNDYAETSEAAEAEARLQALADASRQPQEEK